MRWSCPATLLVFPGLVVAAAAQNAAAPLLDQLIAKVEANYPGYVLEVVANDARRVAYGELVAGLRQRAAATEDAACLWLLRDYVRWFDDGHLFVQEYPRFTAAEIEELRSSTPRIATDGLVAELEENRTALDPIEGVWFTQTQQIVVIADPKGNGTSFSAVILETESPHWQVGHVLAKFRKVRPSAYRAALRADDHAPRRYEANLEHGLLLHMPPHTWGRRFPLKDHERDVLDARNPRAPHLRTLDDDTAVLTVPSFSPEHKSALRAICTKQTAAITSRSLLIVDLRGNEGGSSLLGRLLAPFYHGDERRPPLCAPGRPHVLSSPDTIAYYDRVQGGFFTPKWLRSLRTRLREQPGQLIPLYVPERDDKEPTPRRRHARPEHVALLIDGDVVSAGEAFVLEAGRHTKVRTFGSPTGGTIDYQSVSIVGVYHGELSYGLGYPVIAASDKLPEGGLNRTGIVPQVPIRPEVDDPIAFIRNHYCERR